MKKELFRYLNNSLAHSVRMKGLEPPRLAAPDPKSGVATNYTTSAEQKETKSADEGTRTPTPRGTRS